MQILVEQALDEAQDSAYLVSSQVRLIEMIPEPHFEQQGRRWHLTSLGVWAAPASLPGHFPVVNVALVLFSILKVLEAWTCLPRLNGNFGYSHGFPYYFTVVLL